MSLRDELLFSQVSPPGTNIIPTGLSVAQRKIIELGTQALIGAVTMTGAVMELRSEVRRRRSRGL